MSRAPMAQVDINVPRFSQGMVALLTGLAFVFQLAWLVAFTFLLLLFSWAFGPRLAPLAQLYVRVVRPRLQPGGPTEFEDAQPPRFAQMLGAAALGAATVAFLMGAEVVAWILTLAVTGLATLAAVTRVCVGCALYRHLAG